MWRRLTRTARLPSDYYWKVLSGGARDAALPPHRGLCATRRSCSAQNPRKSHASHARRRAVSHSPRDLVLAWNTHELRAIPRNSSVTHIAICPYFAQMAHRLCRSQRLYPRLQPEAT